VGGDGRSEVDLAAVDGESVPAQTPYLRGGFEVIPQLLQLGRGEPAGRVGDRSEAAHVGQVAQPLGLPGGEQVELAAEVDDVRVDLEQRRLPQPVQAVDDGVAR